MGFETDITVTKPCKRRLFSNIHSFHILFTCLILLTQVVFCCSDRVSHKIYTNLDSSYYCFRRLNQTHQIGCASAESGNSGILKLIRNDHVSEDLNFISNGPNPPYIAALSGEIFNLNNLLQLKKSNRVAGVIVLDFEKHRPKGFSSDSSCPNQHFSLYANDSTYGYCKTQEWNKPTSDHQNGIQFFDWPFPIFLLRNMTEINLTLSKIDNEEWPKLAIELTSPMSAAKDSLTCMRRSSLNSNSILSLTPETFCDPLGGMNIYHHTLNLSKSTGDLPEESVVVLTSRLDSFSFFDNLSPGADSTLSSLIAILSIAEILNRKEVASSLSDVENKALLIALFDGESFDYIGSSQAAFQMSTNSFPLNFLTSKTQKYINLTHLSHFIELNQVAYYDHSSEQYKIFLHKNLKSNRKLEKLIDLIKDESNDLSILIQDVADNTPLPPSSAQSFLKFINSDYLPTLVVTNHEKEYANKYYNSFYEDETDISSTLSVHLGELSLLFARVAYSLVTGRKLDRNIRSNSTLIDGLMDCFYQTSSCDYFQYVQEPSLLNRTELNDEPPFTTYVSVYDKNKSKFLRQYTHALLHYFTGQKIAFTNSSQCHQLNMSDESYSYLWQNGIQMIGECVRSSVYTIDSISPSFNSDTLDIIHENLNKFALWTESQWKVSSVRLFVVSSPIQQIITLVSGIGIFLFSCILVFFLSKKADYLFDLNQTCNLNEDLNENNVPNQGNWSVTTYDVIVAPATQQNEIIT